MRPWTTFGKGAEPHAMRRASGNPQIKFFEANRADHFSILAPVTHLVAKKIQRDRGPTCNIRFTAGEIERAF